MKFIHILPVIFLLITLSCKDEQITTPSPPDPEPDSTSHNFIWEIDTLGTFQSSLIGVWATSADNIWAVGELYLDSLPGSNIAHWNGTNWQFEDIFEGTLKDIIGFSENDIWAVGSWYGAPTMTGAGALICHWNGSSWKVEKLDFEGLWSIYGPSSDNLFAVGYNGTILRYRGNNWYISASGTDLSLWDIWGVSDKNVYAVGGSSSSGVGILLHYDTKGWKTIYERKYKQGIPSGYTSTIWGADVDFYLNSGSGQYSGSDSSWNFINAPTDNTYLETIRGYSDKNIFFVGHFGLIVHWNGKSWQRYEQFFKKPDGDLLKGAWVGEDNVVIVGRSDQGARGIVYRGKMIY